MKRWAIILIILLVIAVPAVALYLRPKKEQNVESITAEKTTLTKDVAFTGRLVPVKDVNLGFETPGTVSNVYVREGDMVHEGDVLAKQDTRTEQLQAAAARAERTSSQEIARIALETAEADASHTKAENARSLEQKRQAVRDAKKALDQAQAIWQEKSQEVDNDSSAAQTVYASVITAESAYHAAQETLATALKSAEKQDAAADAAVKTAQEQYTSTEQASSKVAGLSSSEAREQLAYVAVSKGSLKAPFDGMITSVNVDPGELASAATPLIVLQTVNQLEITADVLESDIADLELGMGATVTFDALPSTDTFEAQITYISDGVQMIEGVPTYKVKLTITNPDSRLRPGLTTNVTVHAAEKANVITIPRRAVITKDEKQYVGVQTPDGNTEERAITTGLIGSDGKVEITSGLNPGEHVITRQEATNP